MAITQTGSKLDFQEVTNSVNGTVSSTITVPADAEIVIVGLSTYSNTNNAHDGMYFTKGGSQVKMSYVGQGDTSVNWEVALFYLNAPDTGTNKSLSYSYPGAQTDANHAYSVTFWKGINTASPVRDSDGANGSGWPRNTPTLTCVNGDKIVAFAGFYYSAGNGAGDVTAWNNLTELAEITNQGIAEGAWATGNPTADTTVGVQSCTGSEGGIAALVLRPAAGGTAYTLTADKGTLASAGQVTALRSARQLPAGLGTLTAGGQPIIVRYARKMPASSGTLTLSGRAASLRYGRGMTVGFGTLTLSGKTAALTYTARAGYMSAGAGSMLIAGQPAALRVQLAAPKPEVLRFGRTVVLRRW